MVLMPAEGVVNHKAHHNTQRVDSTDGESCITLPMLHPDPQLPVEVSFAMSSGRVGMVARRYGGGISGWERVEQGQIRPRSRWDKQRSPPNPCPKPLGATSGHADL